MKETIKSIKEALVALLKVKSIITIGLTAVFMVLSLKGIIKEENFIQIFLMIITFYFTKSSAEK